MSLEGRCLVTQAIARQAEGSTVKPWPNTLDRLAPIVPADVAAVSDA